MILDENSLNAVDEQRKQKIIETVNNENECMVIFNLHFISWNEKSDRDYVSMFKSPSLIRLQEHSLYTEANEDMNTITRKIQRDLKEDNWFNDLPPDIINKVYVANNTIIPYRMPMFSKRLLDFLWQNINKTEEQPEDIDLPIHIILVLLEKAGLKKSPIYISLAYSLFLLLTLMDTDERHLLNFEPDKRVIIFPITIMSRIVKNETDYFMKLSSVFQDVVLPAMNAFYTDTILTRSDKLKNWFDSNNKQKKKLASVFSTDWSEVDIPILEFLETAKEEENDMIKTQ